MARSWMTLPSFILAIVRSSSGSAWLSMEGSIGMQYP